MGNLADPVARNVEVAENATFQEVAYTVATRRLSGPTERGVRYSAKAIRVSILPARHVSQLFSVFGSENP